MQKLFVDSENTEANGHELTSVTRANIGIQPATIREMVMQDVKPIDVEAIKCLSRLAGRWVRQEEELLNVLREIEVRWHIDLAPIMKEQ